MSIVSRTALVMALAFALVTLFAGPLGLAQQKPKIPADSAFEQIGKSPGKVTFSHEKHFEQSPKCTECHVKVFKMKKGTTPGPLSMERMQKGELCGTCHLEGKKGPKGQAIFSVKDEQACARCHVKG